jgi:very-short-patch-repair endonuclease
MPKGVTTTQPCPICKKSISLFAFKRHCSSHEKPRATAVSKPRVAWNKGKTADTDPRVAINGAAVSKTLKRRYTDGELSMSVSKESRRKISESMKLAHAEGRAYSFAHNHGRCEPSYPEKFFARIIEREFADKQVKTEMKFYSYSLDFAWPHLKKAIEIDGEQHERFRERQESDQRKDKKLTENGWQVLRIRWKDIMNDTQQWIQTAKDFITPPSSNG